jgi:hypothetical protein
VSTKMMMTVVTMTVGGDADDVLTVSSSEYS